MVFCQTSTWISHKKKRAEKKKKERERERAMLTSDKGDFRAEYYLGWGMCFHNDKGVASSKGHNNYKS